MSAERSVQFGSPRMLNYRGPFKWLLKVLRSYSAVQVYDDKLVLHGRAQTRDVLYTEISRLQTSHIPYLYALFTVTTRSGKKYRFTAELERNNYILDAITANRPALVATKQMDRFRQTMVALDHCWARIELKMKQTKRLLLSYIVMPLILTAIIAGIRQNFSADDLLSIFGVIAAAHAIAGMIAFITCDLFMQRHTRAVLLQNPLHLLRDIPFEHKLERAGAALHPILTAALIYFLPFQ